MTKLQRAVTYAKSKITVNSILEAARTLFLDKNYADVTITDIAAAAGVSKGALYHHFASKEDIYLQMMHHFLREIQTVTQATADNSAESGLGSCRERLRQSLVSFLQMPDELLNVLRLVRRDINIFTDPIRHDLIAAYQIAVPEQVERIIRSGIESGEIKPINARLLSWQMVALVEVALRPYSRSVLGNAEDMADFLTHQFLDGVATHPSTP